MNCSVVIPHHNGEYLAQCLRHLRVSIKNCRGSEFEIIIVDNHTTDNSLQKIGADIKIISFPKNLGFAAAVNRGIKAAKFPLVLILNNDLNLAPDWLKSIEAQIKKHPQVSGFCGTVLNRDGTNIESQGMEFFMSGRAENRNNGQKKSPKQIKRLPREVWGSSAAAVVYQKTALKKIGLFDESFFAYIEDVDLSFRLHRAGYKTLLVPGAVSCHLGGGTSSKMGNLRAKYTFRNWIKLVAKNYSLKEILVNLPGLTVERLRNLSYLIRSSI